MSDATHYQANLAGQKVALHDGQPRDGYYKLRRAKGGPLLPVAIWTKADGTQVARVSGEMANPEEIWLFCCDNPVSKADAKHAFQHGSWPGDVAPIGHNADPGETLAEKIARIAKDAIAWLRKDGIKTGVDKNLAANYRDQLNGLKKEADAARDAEKRPHLEAGREIDAKYKPLISLADNAAGELRNALTIYMNAEEVAARKVAEAARKAAEAEAEKLAAAGTPVEVPATIMEPPKIRAGGQYGKQTGLRTKVTFLVRDQDLVYMVVKDNPDVKAAIEKAGRALAKAGADVPGMVRTEEKVAA